MLFCSEVPRLLALKMLHCQSMGARLLIKSGKTDDKGTIMSCIGVSNICIETKNITFPQFNAMLLPVITQDAAGVLVEFTILLFLRLGLGAVADLGVLSLLSLLSFLSSIFVLIVVGALILLMGPSVFAICGGLRPVVVRWNSPGRPVIGFSSMYSPPYFM